MINIFKDSCAAKFKRKGCKCATRSGVRIMQKYAEWLGVECKRSDNKSNMPDASLSSSRTHVIEEVMLAPLEANLRAVTTMNTSNTHLVTEWHIPLIDNGKLEHGHGDGAVHHIAPSHKHLLKWGIAYVMGALDMLLVQWQEAVSNSTNAVLDGILLQHKCELHMCVILASLLLMLYESRYNMQIPPVGIACLQIFAASMQHLS